MGEYDETDLTVDQQDDSPLMKRLRHQLKELGKELNTVQAERDGLKTASRTTTISKILGEAKVKKSEKVAKLIPADIEASEAGVKAWLEEFADVFGIEQADPTGTAPTGESSGDAAQAETTKDTGTVSPEVQAAWNAAQATEQAGTFSTPVGAERLLKDLASLEGKSFEAAAKALAGVVIPA